MLGFIACEKSQTNGVHKIHYDIDMCVKCKMVISDRHYVAQIDDRVSDKAFTFDDIGFALLWMATIPKDYHKEAHLY